MRDELPGRPCSVAAALNVVGEKWSLLAIREISFGNKRFDQIARNTGAPRDRLAARLRTLEAAGVIERRRYSSRPPRYEYELTEAGRELRLVVQALRAWGDKWAVDTPPGVFTHSCGHDLDPAMMCRHCGTEVTSDDVTMRIVAPGWSVEGPQEGNAGQARLCSSRMALRYAEELAISCALHRPGHLICDHGITIYMVLACP